MLVLAGALILPAAAGADWSAPALLTRCSAATGPLVIFPASDPHTSSGEGTILWTGDPTACPSPGAPAGIGIAPIGAGDLPDLAESLPRAAGPPRRLGGVVAAAGVGDGRVLLAAAVAPARIGVIEGRAATAFGRSIAVSAASTPVATATSYLGDVALVTVNSRTGKVELRIQHRGVPGLTRRVVMSTRARPVSAVAVGLDYRGDALVAWAQNGLIYRRVQYASGGLDQIEQIAASPPAPQLQALISDDNRGILAWTTAAPAGPGTVSRVYLATSRPGVHFGRPRLLEQFADPPGLGLPDGSLRLVRLASEGVMLGWTGMSHGRYVVRAASISQAAPRPSTVVSDPATDAILTDFATGPRGEAIALWLTAPRQAGSLDAGRLQIVAARGVTEAPGTAVFAAPESVGRRGAVGAPRLAIDPATGDAVAVWRSLGADPGIAYAVRLPAGSARAARPPAPAAAGRGDASTLAWGLAGLAAIALGAGFERARRARRTLRFAREPGRRPRPLGKAQRRP